MRVVKAVKRRPKVALVLGGGSVRGMSHIGVLKVLDNAGIPIDMIAGTSMGSVVGAIYASGTNLDYLAKLVSQLSWEKLLDIAQIGIKKLGIIDGKRFEAILELLLKNKTFEELRIPVRAVATNLENGHEVIFDKGPLIPALRASFSIPGVFTPVLYQGKILVDGAVVAGVPVRAAKEMGPDLTIAVYVGYDIENHQINNMFDVLAQVVDIMTAKLDQLQLKEADLVIVPEVGDVGVSRFDKVEYCINKGMEAAEEALPRIKEIYEQKMK